MSEVHDLVDEWDLRAAIADPDNLTRYVAVAKAVHD